MPLAIVTRVFDILSTFWPALFYELRKKRRNASTYGTIDASAVIPDTSPPSNVEAPEGLSAEQQDIYT